MNAQSITKIHDCSITAATGGVLYRGTETLVERGFKVGDIVFVGGDYSERMGKIVTLNDFYPHQAEIELTHKDRISKSWINSEFLSKDTESPVFSARDYSAAYSQRELVDDGVLYKGAETIVQRGFKVGDIVFVGAAYTENTGKIVEMNSEHYPHEAKVELTHRDGKKTCCWIESKYLSKDFQ